MLRFGIFDHMEQRGDPLHRLYEERLELLEDADAAGFWCYHKAEHHLVPLDAAPSSNVFLAAASQRTDRIRFGPLVYLLPFYHPVRLAEEICMLDHLCRGRLELGVGRGISPPEHALWGHDPEEARPRFEETLDIVLRALTSRTLDYRGRFYLLRELPIQFEPLQKPYPRLWYPGNVDYAARRGLSTITAGPIPLIAATVQRYRERLEQSRGTPERLDADGTLAPLIGAVQHVLVADTDERAESLARAAWAAYTQNLTVLFRSFGLEPPMDPTFGGDFDRARQAEAVITGSPETLREYVARFADGSGCDYFVASFAWGNLTHVQSMDSLELFATKVMPGFNAEPEA